ncbi:ELL-associated factor 2-like [Sinocyclocheilus grahami]|uniref:ELL-associated factor 2-like n=1 Tax=Sinocyclocheilus grahami TaxID=75366 RepID=UPI0007AC6F87|nr:PREDICTED: ELL-associated factor 2-like [Sinocyclocheilus grahami]
MAEARVMDQMSSGDSSSDSHSSSSSSSGDSSSSSDSEDRPPHNLAPAPPQSTSALNTSQSRVEESSGHLMNTLKNDLQLSESGSESDDD